MNKYKDFVILNAWGEITQDNYEEGLIGGEKDREFNWYGKGDTFNTIQELANEVALDLSFSGDPENWGLDEESENTIIYVRNEVDRGDGILIGADREDIEQWKRGEVELFQVTYFFEVAPLGDRRVKDLGLDIL